MRLEIDLMLDTKEAIIDKGCFISGALDAQQCLHSPLPSALQA